MVQDIKIHCALTIERRFCFLDAKFRNREFTGLSREIALKRGIPCRKKKLDDTARLETVRKLDQKSATCRRRYKLGGISY